MLLLCHSQRVFTFWSPERYCWPCLWCHLLALPLLQLNLSRRLWRNPLRLPFEHLENITSLSNWLKWEWKQLVSYVTTKATATLAFNWFCNNPRNATYKTLEGKHNRKVVFPYDADKKKKSQNFFLLIDHKINIFTS